MNHLVIARYQEDIGWVVDVEGWVPLIVQKDVDVPNEGRECSSFFWALHKLYPDLADEDLVACVQGTPTGHGTLDLDSPCEEYRPIGDHHTICDQTGHPHHPGLPVGEKWREWIGTEPPVRIAFTAGGQFVVTGAVVKRKPREEYQRMIGEMTGDNPWIMERLWGHWFYEN